METRRDPQARPDRAPWPAEVDVRRWNGWIEEDSLPPTVAPDAVRLLEAEIGPGRRRRGRHARRRRRGVPRRACRTIPGRVDSTPPTGFATPAARACPTGSRSAAAGSGGVPDAVARPRRRARSGPARRSARARGAVLIPYGGGTSVVGGVTPDPDDDRPAITSRLDAPGRAARPRRARAASRRSAPGRSGRTWRRRSRRTA